MTKHLSEELRRYLQAKEPLLLAEVERAIENLQPQKKIDFEHWWSIYDKKIDRKKCERLWNRLPVSDQERAVEHTSHYVAVTPVIKHRRHPYTYLNNENWNDNDLIKANTEHNQEEERNIDTWRNLGINI